MFMNPFNSNDNDRTHRAYSLKFKVDSSEEAIGKILLIFPPLFTSPQPHLALPHLSAYLRKNGYAVTVHDFNSHFIKLAHSERFLNFLQNLITKKLSETQNKDFRSKASIEDIRAKYAALAAIASLKKSTGQNLTTHNYPVFLKKLFCLLRGFGFPGLHLYNHDFADFAEDYFIFQKVQGKTFDERFPWRQSSTIDQQIHIHDIIDNGNNLYLTIFQKYFIRTIFRKNYRIAGISIPTNEQVIPALSLAYQIKKNYPDIHLTLGGGFIYHLGVDDQKKIINFPFVDSMVLNEGEKALLALAKALSDHTSLAHVPNIIYKVGKNYFTNSITIPEKLDELPPPDYDDFPPVLTDLYELGVYAGRKCYWSKCNYCNYVTTTNREKTHVSLDLSAHKIVDHLEMLQKKYGAFHFRLITDALPPLTCRQLSQEIIDRNLKVSLNFWVRAEKQFTPELCRLMAQAGLSEITVGLESLSERILTEMNKGYKQLQAVTVINNMINAGLNLQINMIVGYPTETIEESEESLNILKTKIGLNKLSSLSIFPFVLFNNIGVFRKADEYGLKLFPQHLRRGFFRPKNIFVRYQPQKGMSFQDIGTMITKYADAFRESREAGNFETTLAFDEKITVGSEIAGVRMQNILFPKGRQGIRAETSWMIINFTRSSIHIYADYISQFLAWVASHPSTFHTCVASLEKLGNLSRNDAQKIIFRLLDDGLISV